MTPGEHYTLAEALAARASKFHGSLEGATQQRPGGEPKKALPLSVINYVAFLQGQASVHALLAAAPPPTPFDEARSVPRRGDIHE